MAPDVGRSRPASRFSSVDLPEPELPSSARNSPEGISSETSLTAGMRVSPRRYCRETFCAWSKGWVGVWIDGMVVWGVGMVWARCIVIRAGVARDFLAMPGRKEIGRAPSREGAGYPHPGVLQKEFATW